MILSISRNVTELDALSGYREKFMIASFAIQLITHIVGHKMTFVRFTSWLMTSMDIQRLFFYQWPSLPTSFWGKANYSYISLMRMRRRNGCILEYRTALGKQQYYVIKYINFINKISSSCILKINKYLISAWKKQRFFDIYEDD